MLDGRAERVLHTRAPEIAAEKVVSVGATKANIVNGVGEGEVKLLVKEQVRRANTVWVLRRSAKGVYVCRGSSG